MVEDATEDALAASSSPHPLLSHTPTSNPHQTTAAPPGASAAAAAKPQAAKRKRAATSKASEALGLGVEADDQGSMPVVTPRHRQASKKAGGPGEATPAEAVAAAVEAVTSDVGKKKVKRQRVKASEVAVSTEVELVEAPAQGMCLQNQARHTVAWFFVIFHPPRTGLTYPLLCVEICLDMTLKIRWISQGSYGSAETIRNDFFTGVACHFLRLKRGLHVSEPLCLQQVSRMACKHRVNTPVAGVLQHGHGHKPWVLASACSGCFS